MNEQREPQSVEEWIERINRTEYQVEEPDNDSPLPSGWWILPGLMLAAIIILTVASCT